MKHIAIFVLFVGLILPLSAQAATFGGGETYTISEGETIPDNLYAGAGDITIGGTVLGDVIIAGGSLTVTGRVRDDLTLAGGNITILAPIGGDARIAGGNVVFNKSAVGGDMMIAGGSIKVLGGSTAGGDVIIAGGAISFSGTGAKDARFAGGQVTIDGALRGDVLVEANERIILTENARIDGNLVYRGEKESILEVRDGAVVKGATTFEEQRMPISRGDVTKGLAAFFGVLFLIKFITVLVAGIVAVLVFRQFSLGLANEVIARPWRSLLLGFAVLVLVPIASLMLLVTVLGAYVGMLLIASYVLLMVVVSLYSGVMFGAWLYKLIKKGDTIVSWRVAFVGIILLSLIKLVPVVGWIVCLLVFLATLGATAQMVYERLWMRR